MMQSASDPVSLNSFADHVITVRSKKGSVFRGVLVEASNETGEIKLKNAVQIEPPEEGPKNPTEVTFALKEVHEVAVMGKDETENMNPSSENMYLTLGSDCGAALKLRITEEILDYLASMSGRNAGSRRRNTGSRGGLARSGLPARYDPTREQYESVHITLPKTEMVCRGIPLAMKGAAEKKADAEKYYKKDEFFDHLSSSTTAEGLAPAPGTVGNSMVKNLVGAYLRDQGRNQLNAVTFGQPGLPEYVRLLARPGGWGVGRGRGSGGGGGGGGRWNRNGGRGAVRGGRGGRGGNRGNQQGGNRNVNANNNPQGGLRGQGNNQLANTGQQNQGNLQRGQQRNQQGNQQSWNQGSGNNTNVSANAARGGRRRNRRANNNRTYGRDGSWNSTPLTQEQYNALVGNTVPSWMGIQSQNASGGLNQMRGGQNGSGNQTMGNEAKWTFPTSTPVIEATA